MELKELMASVQSLELEDLQKMLAENEKEHETLKMLIGLKEGKTLTRKPRKRVTPESGG